MMIQLIENSQFMDRDLSIFTNNLSLPRHRWYEFKEGFSESLVSEAVRNTTSDLRQLRILDPFAGTGTTLVTAGKLGHSAIGIEVNPFLAFAARGKCAPASAFRKPIRSFVDSVLSDTVQMASILEGLSTFTYKPKATKWLFNRGVIRGFTALDQALESTADSCAPLRLALFASLMDCCNAKRDGKCLRYRRDWRKLRFGFRHLRSTFRRRAEIVAEDISLYPFDTSELTVLEGDSRKRLKELESDQFDLVVTSPPYLNSFDYSDIYRPELFAGGFVKNNKELRQLRLNTVRSHVQVKWEAPSLVSSPLVSPLFEQLKAKELWNNRLPSMIQAYFCDMADVLKECARLVKKGGSAWIVVGTSAYGGIEIPVDLILADIATRNGWTLSGVYVLRQLRSAGQHWAQLNSAKKPLRESLIVVKR